MFNCLNRCRVNKRSNDVKQKVSLQNESSIDLEVLQVDANFLSSDRYIMNWSRDLKSSFLSIMLIAGQDQS